MSERVALLFTKPAQPGRVKTRLIGDITAEQAAQLHAAFVTDMLARLDGGAFELRLAWALEPGEELPESPLVSVRQHGGDLGARLYRALKDAAVGAASVAAIGSDHPEMKRSDLEGAFAVLEAGTADVVLGPALDGGYYLLAIRSEALDRSLFEGISWSTARVFGETLRRCRALGLTTHELRPASDVDTPSDLTRLAGELVSGRVKSPLAAGLLQSWGRLPQSLPEEGME